MTAHHPTAEKPVLVLSNGREMAALPLIRSLGRSGCPVLLASIVADHIAAPSRYVSRFVIMPDPVRDVAGWLDWLRGLLDATPVAAVTPVGDDSLVPLYTARARFGDATLMIPGESEFELAFDKANTFRAARELGVPMPQTEVLALPEDAAEVAARLSNSFPLIVKPGRSRLQINNRMVDFAVRRVHSLEELRSTAAELLPHVPLLVQSYHTGRGIGQEFLLDRGEVVCEFQHERAHEPLHGGGGSYRCSARIDAELREHSLKLLRLANWSGVAMVEYLRTPDGKALLMEINGRFWGSLPLPVAAGVDFPARWLKLLQGEQLAPQTKYKVPVYCRNLERDLKWLRANWKADHSDPSLKTVPRGKTIGELLRIFSGSEYWDEWTRDDARPGRKFLLKLARKVCRKLRLKLLRLPLLNRLYCSSAAKKLQRATRIISLCKGNTCRSPFLAEYLKLQATERGLKLPPIDSRGLIQHDGTPSSDEARVIARKHGVDLSAHRSRAFYGDERSKQDIFLIVDPQHTEEVLAHYRPLKPQFIYWGLLDPDDKDPTVIDPDRTNLETYAAVYARLRRAGDRVLAKLRRSV